MKSRNLILIILFLNKWEPCLLASFEETKANWLKRIERSKLNFSRELTDARELWVAHTFINSLGIECSSSDFVKENEQNSIVDVYFNDMQIQVKELQENERKRSLELEEQRKLVEAASCEDELIELILATGHEPLYPKVECVVNRVEEFVALKSKAYGLKERNSTDFLVYYNFQDIWGIQGEDFSPVGGNDWRSVSVTRGSWSLVISASDLAPKWLKEKVGVVFRSSNELPDVSNFQ